MPETTQEIIERVGLIPVLRAKSVAQGRAVVDAMIAGGVNIVEVTMLTSATAGSDAIAAGAAQTA